MKPHECPVYKQSVEVLETSQQLAKSMRRLRRMIRKCLDCKEQADCPVMEEFNASFLEALAEISEQWELDRWYG
jgi:hypothetical protein